MPEYPEAASADNRGTLTYADEGEGVGDILAVSRKNSADEFEWVELTDTFQLFVENLTGSPFTNLGAGPVESATTTAYVDLTDYTEIMFTADIITPGVTGVLKIHFVTADETTTQSIALSQAAGVHRSDWAAIPVASRSLQLIGDSVSGGDGAEDPEVGIIVAHFRR